MNRARLSSICLAIFIAYSHLANAQPVSPGRDRILMEQLNSYGNTIFSLAGERFAFHESKNETWVLLVHQSTNAQSLVKYRQGNITVASIPINEIGRHGARLYVTRYNTLTLQKADRLALDEKYTEALEIYRPLFEFAEGLADSDQLKRRIESVEKLLKKQDVAKSLKTLKSLAAKPTNNTPSTYDLLEIQPATTTTNLLSIQFPGQHKEEKEEVPENEKEKTTPAL